MEGMAGKASSPALLQREYEMQETIGNEIEMDDKKRDYLTVYQSLFPSCGGVRGGFLL